MQLIKHIPSPMTRNMCDLENVQLIFIVIGYYFYKQYVRIFDKEVCCV